MRKRTKQAKQDLEKKVSDLETKLNELKSQLNEKEALIDGLSTQANNSLLNSILENELLFYFIYSKDTQSIEFPSEPTIFFETDLESNLNGFLQIIHSEDKETVKKALTSSITLDKPVTFRTKSVHKESKIQQNYKLSISPKPLKEIGENDFLVTIQNISKETKQKKEIIKGKEKAEESDKLKNIFLSKISQYIRTPMNSIVGFSELLTIHDPGEKQRIEFLDVIRRQSKTLLDIVNDISEIAKYSTGNIEIKRTIIDLNLVLNEIVLGFEQLHPDKRKEEIRINAGFNEQQSFKMYSDSGRIQQICSNLISHLLSIIDKGSINITFGEPVDNKFDIIISSPDIIFPKEKLKDYFELYTYSESDATSKYNESGIGLAISKIVAKAMNGKIQLLSDEETGVQFIITLPYEDASQEKNQENLEEPIEGFKYDFKDKVILIVDDEEVNIMFIEAVINGTNAKTITAKNGYEAIELCKTLPKIDLILMDILMPGISGIKTAGEIRKFNPHVPIIAQTALSQTEDHDNCLKAGCNTTITKPIEVEKLLMLLDMYFMDK